MAIGFRNQTQIASGGATDPMSAPALPASTATGDMVLLFVIVKYASTTINTPTDWTPLNNGNAANSGLTDSGNDAGNIRAAIFWREKTAGWSTMPAVDLSGTPNCTMVGAISYTKGGSETWVTPEGAGIADNTAAAAGVVTGNAATTISLTTGDLFGSFCGQNGDVGTFSSHNVAVTGVTFGAQTARLAAATSSGTDLRGHSIERPYSSGTATTGPAGDMQLTAGGASTAGVFVFYRLRVAALVSAVFAAPLNSLTATAAATVTAGAVHAVLAAPLGALTGTATATYRKVAVLAAPLGTLAGTVAAIVEHPVVLAAPLGSLSATGTAVPKHPAVLAAGLGVLAAAITATPEHPATLAAPLGSLTATASATASSGSGTVSAVLLAALGALTSTATATTEHPVTAVAACGGLTATAGAVVQHSAVGAATLGALVAAANATPTTPTTVDAVLSAQLGMLVAHAAAHPVLVITPTVFPSVRPVGVGFPEASDWGEVVEWVAYLNEPRY